MSEPKHSPEPWRDDPDFVVRLRDATDEAVGAVPGAANARRIVACVNACAGIPTAALESGALTKALDVAAKARREGWYEEDPRWIDLVAALVCLGRLPCSCKPGEPQCAGFHPEPGRLP